MSGIAAQGSDGTVSSKTQSVFFMRVFQGIGEVPHGLSVCMQAVDKDDVPCEIVFPIYIALDVFQIFKKIVACVLKK